MRNSNLEFALRYVSIGLYIFPCHSIKIGKCSCNRKECDNPGKHPKTVNGFKDATINIDLIKKWWNENPDANIGCATGVMSGIVVLDLDIKHGRSSKEFQIPPTPSVKTGGGGEHFIFKYPGFYIKSTSGQLFGPGVDIKADGGYVILAPSSHISGNNYEWIVPIESKEDLAEIPKWLLKAIKKDKEKKSSNKLWQKHPDEVLEGGRNNDATSTAGKIRSSLPPELSETVGWPGLLAWNQEIPKPLPEKELRTVWESIKKYSTNDIREDSKNNLLLNEICNREDVTLFHDEQKDAYISLDISGHQEIWLCDSSSIKNFLSFKSWIKNKKPLGSEAINNIIAVLEGKARFEGPEIKLHNRVAWHEDTLWYDLTNKTWQVVKINESGWEIVNKPPIIFNRYSHHQSQVIPVQNGDIKLFLNYINITNQQHRLLLLVFLVSCFIPDFPHVMLVIFGAQGSSKSTFSKLTRLTIDPSMIDVVALPEKQNELVQILAHHHALFFDNVSHVSEDSSDTICRAITGSGFSKRKLYKNDEDLIYKFNRCLGINGINLVTIKPDLLERSLLIELERIDPKNRRHETELYKNFSKDLPSILGGIFDVLVKTLKIKPELKISSLPRMADWALWGCAISEALNYTKEEFLNAYGNNINRQAEMLLNENIVATTVFSFMEDKNEWKGTATELLQSLYAKTPIDYFEKQEKFWPKSAGSLSRKLNELSTYLKQMGISVIINTSGQERYIHIIKTTKKQKEPTQSPLTDNTYDTDDIITTPPDNIPPQNIPF